MKTVLLIRHAKSSWDNFTLSDFERTLNDRGKRNAPEMGKRLRKRKIMIDAFLSSPAERAKKTAELFAKELDYPKKAIIYLPELYHATPEVFTKVIAEAPDGAEVIAIFSHNPGITAFASMLTDHQIDNMPTSGVFAVESDANDWSDFESAARRFLFFDYPKLAPGDGD